MAKKQYNRYQVAQKIAKASNCSLQNHGGNFVLYDKNTDGWRGCITSDGVYQGVASDSEILAAAGLNPAEPTLAL